MRYEFSARVNGHSIQIFYAGKWRGVRYYQSKTYPPSPKIVKEALDTFLLNAGLKTVKHAEVTLDWMPL